MAFCTKCGRQLQEGEVCTCQQTTQTPGQPVTPPPAQAGTPVQPGSTQPGPVQPAAPAQPGAAGVFFKELWETIQGLVKKPVDTAISYTNKGSFPMAGVIIAVVAIFQGLFGMFGRMAEGSGSSGDSWADLFDSLVNKPNYFAIFMNGLLSVLVAAALVALIIMLLVQTLGGGKLTYVQGLSVVSLMLVWSVAVIPVAFLIDLIPVSFFAALAGWIRVFASAVGIVLAVMAVKSVIVKENMLPYIIACAMVVDAFSTYIIGLMFR